MFRDKQTVAPLPHPCRVSKFHDAGLYAWPQGVTWVTWEGTTYSLVLVLDDTVIKLPSAHGFSEYRKYVVREEYDNDAIRRNEPVERLGNLNKLLGQYSAWDRCPDLHGELHTHWLLLHKLQYDRLRKNTKIAIPKTRFAFLHKRRFVFRSKDYPALVQERIDGISLWEMIDHDVSVPDPDTHCFVLEKYKKHIPSIARQLRPLASSPWSKHINWHIMNFIYQPLTSKLFYVDLKPSNIFGKWRNDQNLRNIRRDFLQ
jgi:hypothetical protein